MIVNKLLIVEVMGTKERGLLIIYLEADQILMLKEGMQACSSYGNAIYVHGRHYQEEIIY